MTVPIVNVTVDSGAAYVQETIHAIVKTLNPHIFSAPAPEERNDRWGTPLEWAEMNNTWDVRNSMTEARMGMYRRPSAMSMLCMRMKWGPYSEPVQIGADTDPPFDHISIHLSAEEAIVFIVTRGEPVTVRDDIGIFPSDALVTQLKLLEQRQTPPPAVPVP